MRAAALKIPDNVVPKRALRLTTKNAWAAYARRRWRTNALAMIMDEWDLSEGEARGLLYASVSQRTIDKVLDHLGPCDGFRLALEVLLIRQGISFEQFIEHEKERLEHEGRRIEEERRSMAEMARRLPAVLSLVAGSGD